MVSGRRAFQILPLSGVEKRGGILSVLTVLTKRVGDEETRRCIHRDTLRIVDHRGIEWVGLGIMPT